MQTNRMIIDILKELYASEWLAAYQYRVSADLLKGVDSLGPVFDEFIKHYEEEIDHAKKLSDRLTQLGSKPIIYFKNLEKYSPCPYPKHLCEDNRILILESLKGELCAINSYKKAIEIIKECNDDVTYDILVDILEDEEEHKVDLVHALGS